MDVATASRWTTEAETELGLFATFKKAEKVQIALSLFGSEGGEWPHRSKLRTGRIICVGSFFSQFALFLINLCG